MLNAVWVFLYVIAGAVLVAWPVALVWFDTIESETLHKRLTALSIWSGIIALVVFAHLFHLYNAYLTFLAGWYLLYIVLYLIGLRLLKPRITARKSEGQQPDTSTR